MACTIGQQLKQARLAKGLSLEEVSHATKIAVFMLEAMELDDFSVFTNSTYRRSFLKLYSRHLGVDPAEMLASLNRIKPAKKARPEFLLTDLNLTPTEQTIPIVKHRVIERKPKRSAMGFVLFLLLALMLPAVFYAGKWKGLREAMVQERVVAPVGERPSEPPEGNPKETAIRAQVITPSPKDRYGDLPVRVYGPDPQMNALLGLDASPGPRKEP